MGYVEFYQLVGFFFLVLGGLAGAWWRIETRVEKAKYEAMTAANAALARAEVAAAHLSEFREKVAETYISKQGHRETTEQVMEALRAVKTSVDRLGERLDRVVDGPAPRRRASRSDNE